jgi:hypothetical protein
MEIRKCHLCDADIFPGEKRCLIAVHIFPDQDNDLFLDQACSDEKCSLPECMEEMCDCGEDDLAEELFQEVHLVLCKDCQDQFMKNPFLKENFLFLRSESESKTLH